MKTLKLVLGIISIVLTFLILFQSCAAGVSNALTENGEVSGTAGFMVAIVMLAGGIVMIATRNSKKNGGSIACIIMYVIAALLGFSNAGTFSDLNLWSFVCLVLAVVCLISIFTNKKTKESTADTENK